MGHSVCFLLVLGRVSVAVIFIWLILLNHRRKLEQELKQGWNLEVGANAETIKGLLACSHDLLVQPSFL